MEAGVADELFQQVFGTHLAYCLTLSMEQLNTANDFVVLQLGRSIKTFTLHMPLLSFRVNSLQG